MGTCFFTSRSLLRRPSGVLVRLVAMAALLLVLGTVVHAQAPNPADRERRREAKLNGRPGFNLEEMQQRLMGALREQFGVTDDAEWQLISDRIMAIYALRRATGGMAGMVAFRAGVSPQNARARRPSGSPEQDALRQALVDKLTDAEIKSRLDRFREARKANEDKLAKAQEDLRAILTVRQEAIAVIAGLLP